jgi:hypothetical protein
VIPELVTVLTPLLLALMLIVLIATGRYTRTRNA